MDPILIVLKKLRGRPPPETKEGPRLMRPPPVTPPMIMEAGLRLFLAEVFGPWVPTHQANFD